MPNQGERSRVHSIKDLLRLLIGSKVALGDRAAVGYVHFSGVPNDGDATVIGGRTYEYDTNGSFTAGNVQVDISGSVTVAQVVDALVAAVNGDASGVVTALDRGEMAGFAAGNHR